MARTVQNAVDEIQAETTSDLSDASMLNYFKSGARFIPALIRSRMFLAEDSLSLGAGSQTDDLSDLSPAFSEEIDVWYVDSDSARVPISRPPSRTYFWQLYGSQSAGKPEFYIIDGLTIKFDKALDATTTWGISYYKDTTDSIALVDTITCDETLFEALKCFTKAEYYLQYEEDETKSGIYERKGKEIIASLQKRFQFQEYASGTIEEIEMY